MIGILTYHSAHNYGAALQTFALFYYIKSEGKNVEIINYIPDYFEQAYANGLKNNSISNVLKNLKHLKNIQMRQSQVYKFEDFKSRYLEISSNIIKNFDFLSDDAYEKIIFGSDQIWNNNINFNDSSYFGKGLIDTKTKCYAYAASVGTNILNDFQSENLKKYTSKFEKIGLRELTFMPEVKDLTHKEVRWTLDPVFLLPKETWKSILKLKKENTKKYILLYELKGDKELEQYCKRYAKEHNLKVVNIHPTCNWKSSVRKQVSNIGPIDFVRLIENAELICTDSFHGTAFSIIFEKRYIASTRYVEDSRINSIITLTGVEKRKIIDTELLQFDFSVSRGKNLLDEQIKKSKMFLKSCL